jgi:hypothetical protein
MLERRDNDGPNRAPRIVWTTDHRLRGVAYAVVTMRYKQDVYASGIPGLSFLVKGVKVYDPRTGLTAWTENAALIAADYLASEYGPAGVGYGEIHEATLIAAANVCDEEVTHTEYGLTIPGIAPTTVDPPPGVSGPQVEATVVTEPRYRVSAAVSAEEDWRQVAPKLALAMAGGIFRVGAGWYVIAGAPTTPTAQLGENDMAGELDVLPRRSRRDLFNRVQALSRNSHDLHQVWDAPPLQPRRYFLQDAQTILVNAIDMTPVVASPTQALRLASIELEQNRQQITATGVFKWRALTVEVGDVVEITSERMGWADKPFRVVRWELDLEEGVRLGLAEYCDAIYAYPPEPELGDCAPDTNLLMPPGEFDVTNVAVVRENEGPSTIVWTAPLSPQVTGYEARWKPIGELPSDRYAITDGTWIALEMEPPPDWAAYDVAAVTFEIEADMFRSWVYRAEVRSLLGDLPPGSWVGINSFPKPGGSQSRSVVLLSSADELDPPAKKLLSGDMAPGGIALHGGSQYVDPGNPVVTTRRLITDAGDWLITSDGDTLTYEEVL